MASKISSHAEMDGQITCAYTFMTTSYNIRVTCKENPVLCYSQNKHVQVLYSDINFELATTVSDCCCNNILHP